MITTARVVLGAVILVPAVRRTCVSNYSVTVKLSLAGIVVENKTKLIIR